jgi:diguanylate cyclase (GGDEF)-like protein
VRKRSADNIIASIAQITGHTDRELLETSLASTLYEILDVDRVAIYKIFYEYKKAECYLGIEVTDDEAHLAGSDQPLTRIDIASIKGLGECINGKQPQLMHMLHGQCLYHHPIVSHLGTVISVFSLHGSEQQFNDSRPYITGYFQIYRNYLHLLDESEHDTLTGLLNRRTFEQNLEKILNEWHKANDTQQCATDQRCRRQQTEKGNWLAVIDIDHFKRVNDQYGHLYGDEVLLLLANIMRESFRGYDKLFRFGGEEFVAILRTTDRAGTHKALERFRGAVASYNFPKQEGITISIGYVEIANQAIPAEVLGHADDALYYAKEHGRNQAHQYEALVAAGKLTSIKTVIKDDVELF